MKVLRPSLNLLSHHKEMRKQQSKLIFILIQLSEIHVARMVKMKNGGHPGHSRRKMPLQNFWVWVAV